MELYDEILEFYKNNISLDIFSKIDTPSNKIDQIICQSVSNFNDAPSIYQNEFGYFKVLLSIFSEIINKDKYKNNAFILEFVERCSKLFLNNKSIKNLIIDILFQVYAINDNYCQKIIEFQKNNFINFDGYYNIFSDLQNFESCKHFKFNKLHDNIKNLEDDSKK